MSNSRRDGVRGVGLDPQCPVGAVLRMFQDNFGVLVVFIRANRQMSSALPVVGGRNLSNKRFFPKDKI